MEDTLRNTGAVGVPSQCCSESIWLPTWFKLFGYKRSYLAASRTHSQAEHLNNLLVSDMMTEYLTITGKCHPEYVDLYSQI